MPIRTRQDRSPHARHVAVPAHQGAVPRRAALLSDGRLLRALLRRRAQGRAPARHHADRARHVRRRTDPDGRRAGADPGHLPRDGRAQRRVDRDLRTDRRPGQVQGSGRAAGRARRDARHGHGRWLARGTSRHAARRRLRSARTGSDSPGSNCRAGAFMRCRQPARKRSRRNSSGCGRRSCSSPRTRPTAAPARSGGAMRQRPPWHFEAGSA